jgi:hypothetical protein
VGGSVASEGGFEHGTEIPLFGDRAELTASESRWYVTFVMVDSAPIVHEFSSRHDVGDPIFDWRLSDQTAVIEHFEERLRAAGYHPVRSEDWLPPLAVAAWTLSPSDA